jgi:hypothetical protein
LTVQIGEPCRRGEEPIRAVVNLRLGDGTIIKLGFTITTTNSGDGSLTVCLNFPEGRA